MDDRRCRAVTDQCGEGTNKAENKDLELLGTGCILFYFILCVAKERLTEEEHLNSDPREVRVQATRRCGAHTLPF